MSFNTNFQLNIAQMNLVSKEQEKNKNISRKQQDKVGEHLEKIELTQQDRVSETHDKDNSTKVRDDEKNTELANQHNPEIEKDVSLESEPQKDKKVVIFKDEDKGKIIDFSG